MVINLTKSRMTKMLSSLRRIFDYGKGAYLYRDYIIPKEETLSRSIIKTILPMNFGVIMVMDDNFSEASSKISKETGISNIKLIFDEDDNTLFMNYSKDDMVTSFIIASPLTTEVDDSFISSVIGLFDDFDMIIKEKCSDMDIMTEDELNKVRLSEVVKLQNNGLTVRMSRDNVPLTGALRQTGPIPFKIKYKINEIVIDENDKDYRLILYVNYKDFDAIHMYSFIPY